MQANKLIEVYYIRYITPDELNQTLFDSEDERFAFMPLLMKMGALEVGNIYYVLVPESFILKGLIFQIKTEEDYNNFFTGIMIGSLDAKFIIHLKLFMRSNETFSQEMLSLIEMKADTAYVFHVVKVLTLDEIKIEDRVRTIQDFELEEWKITTKGIQERIEEQQASV
jgi:hypothetical protein